MAQVKVSRMLSVLIAMLLCLGSVAALAASAEIIHYSYGPHGDAWREYLNLMALRFEEETGISVNIMVSGSGGDYRDKLFTMLAVGAAPDVTDANPAIAAPFLGQDSFVDLRPYVERDGLAIDQMPPAALQGVSTPDGRLWGLPVSIFPVFTFYNADLFSQAGLQNPADLGDQWTWATMSEAARRLTYDADGDGVNDFFGTSRVHWRWEMQVHQAGGQLYDRLVYPSQSRFDSPEVREAIEYLHNMVVVDRLNSPNVSTHDFGIGNVGFTVVDGPGAIGNNLRNVGFEWGVAMQPMGPANRAARVNPDGFQILADSPQREEAWQWIRFLTASPDNQLEMARVTGRMPSLRETMLHYPDMTPGLPENWMAIVNTAFDPDGYAAYVLPNAGLIDPVVNARLNKIWQGVEPPGLVLQQIHDLVSKLLEDPS